MVGKFKIIWEPISDKSKVSIEMMIFLFNFQLMTISIADLFMLLLVLEFCQHSYLKFIEFDGIGGVGKRYIKTGH